jgi:hypothetical protein
VPYVNASDGCRIYYEEEGTGEPLLLIAGAGASLDMWTEVRPSFARRLQPVNPDGSSTFKQGSTVPVKFRVCDANGISIGASGPVVKIGSDGHRAPVLYFASNSTGIVDETVLSTTPDTDFRWDPTNSQWIFNLSSKNLKSGVHYYYRIDLVDGTSIGFDFGIK